MTASALARAVIDWLALLDAGQRASATFAFDDALLALGTADCRRPRWRESVELR
jgi:hypothetical protein